MKSTIAYTKTLKPKYDTVTFKSHLAFFEEFAWCFNPLLTWMYKLHFVWSIMIVLMVTYHAIEFDYCYYSFVIISIIIMVTISLFCKT